MAHVPKANYSEALWFGKDSPPSTPGLRVELDLTKPNEEFLPLPSHTYWVRGVKWLELAPSQQGRGYPFGGSTCKGESV